MKNNKSFIYILIIFFVISINSIYSFTSFLTKDTYSLITKQSIFYIIGIVLIVLLLRFKPEKLFNYSFIIYIVNVLLLILVLFIGTEINGTKAWFSIPIFGTFQPSEFMKIGLILFLAKVIDNHKIKTLKDEILLIIKVLIITIIPSIITFLEPDTGAVLIYFIIAFAMLFISKIRIRWFVILFIIIITIVSIVFYLYTIKTDTFINMFGSNMFYRFDRIFDWKKGSGLQLENSLISISSSGLLGHGFNKTPIYFPESSTDFIFAVLSSNFGLLLTILFLGILLYFDVYIIRLMKKKISLKDKLAIAGISSCLIFQHIENIGMTIGILPITGITLPFISYGGSSLISYMIMLGIIFNVANSKIKKT